MGYRFSLETANTVANLAFGKVLSCYRDIFSTENRYWEFKEFLDTFDENFFIGNNQYYDYRDSDFAYRYRYRGSYLNRREFYLEIVRKITIQLNERRHNRFDSQYNDYADNINFYRADRELIELLGVLSDLMRQCRVKSLLLPEPYFEKKGNNNEFMTDVRTLNRLLHWHPHDTCLILQPKERPSSKNITIFDAFPHFDFALRQLDLWPAVMFWNNRNDFIFAPIQDIDELETMYAIMHYEKRAPFKELKRIIADKIKPAASHYYLHLSDLHFGAKNIPVNGRRLRTLVDKQVASFTKDNNESTINFVITGDVVDSPKPQNTTEYNNFYDFLSRHSNSSISPLLVLGNHDINNHGLAIGNNNQKIINSVGPYPKIEVDNNTKVIFLLFNSNSKGSLAEGEIGTEQLSEMGNQLDKILAKNNDISDYKKVAILHHHLIKIPNPEWRTEHWYKKLLPSSFLEKALHLRDADIFKEWLKKRNVKLVLHGHKHVPFIGEDDGINIVACGSSTGQIKNIDPQKTYISYNVLKFNKETVTCTLYAEDLLGSGAIDIQTSSLNY